MAIPKFEDFLFPFLTQLKDKDVSSKEMKDALVQHFGLTEEDRLLRMPTERRKQKRIPLLTHRLRERK